ncbi:MAG: GNAT family N-acetyltransferase [Solobacterium sp.]|nr:GNAT family N-acetyltransferase [Solobacterium sp.]
MLFRSILYRRNPRIKGTVIDLVEEQFVEADSSNNYTPSYLFGMYLHDSFFRVGNCDLRLGETEELYYAGNIGYHVDLPYRGNHYAYEACLLLFDKAKALGLSSLIITCSPENEASRKTLEKLKGTYLETVDVPSDHWLYQRGETVKRIYRYSLNGTGL